MSVFYALALASFSVAAFYGFRLTRLTRKTRVMVMVTRDGPTSLVGGLILLAASQVYYLVSQSVNSLSASNIADIFGVPAGILLMGSAVMFAWGFHKLYAVYLNEKLKMNVTTVLDELVEKEEQMKGQFQQDYR